MTPRQTKRNALYHTMYRAVKHMETPTEARVFLKEFALQMGVKYSTARNKLYDIERQHGNCDWRQDERQEPADYCTEGVCLMCKRATDSVDPAYANGKHCEACNDTGYYTEAVMHPERVNASQRQSTANLAYILIKGCTDYDSYVTKCRGASIPPLKFTMYRQHCKTNGGSNSPYSSKIATRNKDIRETLGDMNNITNKAYAMALDMLAEKYSVKQSTIANLNRAIKRESREGRRQ